MADQSLRPLLQQLEAGGDLIRFTRPVDPHTQLASLQWRAFNERRQSSLFDNVAGYPGWRVVGQILADRHRWSLALGVPFHQLLPTLAERIRQPIPPEVVAGPAPVQEQVWLGDEVDITRLPATYASEQDQAPFLAAGMAIIKDPETGILNVSVHRMQVTGPRETSFFMVPRHAAHIFDKYRRRGQNMPVAVVIGAHPALYFGSSFTGSLDLDEFGIMGAVLGEPARLVRAKTVDLGVPAEAEIVLEGEILQDADLAESPFGEVTGLYARGAVANVFRVNAMTRRADAIYYALQSGFPISDSQVITSVPMEVVLWDRIRTAEGLIDLKDLRVLNEAGNLTVCLQMTPRFEGQAKNALLAALSSPYLHPKIAIAVDDDVDIHDPRHILWSLSTRVNPARDTFIIDGVRTFPLDWSGGDIITAPDGRSQRYGSKMGIDATRPSTMLPDRRSAFERAMPRGYGQVRLEDFIG